MVNAALTDKQRYTLNHFQNHTANRPDIDLGRVMSGAENQLRSSVASRTNVRQVWLVCQYLCRPKITNHSFFSFNQNIVGFYVSVTDSKGMNVVKPSENLVSDQLDVKSVETLFAVVFDVVEQIPVVVFHDDAQVLTSVLKGSVCADDLHHKLGVEHLHNLNLPILVFGVLEDLLNGDQFTCFNHSTFIHLTECSLADKTQNFNVIATQDVWSGIESTLGF